MTKPSPSDRRPLVVNHQRKRSVWFRVVPLVVILAAIYFLPRLLALLEG